MELKSLKDFISIITFNSSNRTFMELKLGIVHDNFPFFTVLIVPLWN